MTKRVLWSLVVLLLVATVAFFAVNLLLPYDFAVGLGGRRPAIDAIREQLGLDRALVIRWLDYLWHLIRGDLGQSYYGFGVTRAIWDVLPVTVMIFAVGGIIAYLVGEWFGRWVAWSRNRWFRGLSTTSSVLMFTAFPPWLVFLLVYFGSERLFHLRSELSLPLRYYGPPPEGPLMTWLAIGLVTALVTGIVLRARARRRDHRILAAGAIPACLAALMVLLAASGVFTDALDLALSPSGFMATVALTMIATGENMLVMRAGVTSEMMEDYVFTAQAKGVPGRLIRDRHIAPNAVVPTISRLVSSMPYLIAGLIIIERELSLQGVSSLFFVAIEAADVPMIIGILVVVGVVGLVLRIVLDFVQASIDPRLRVEGESI
ncbi:MAG: ABC transporter permease [Actinobacteria bacterium]|nr:ABC transporter permease [Actinomycetota bacterium]MBU1866788.1 ABC transporter permease [Actinomycetota bacterium]